MTGFVVVGDLMTDVVAIASVPLAYGSDTRAVVDVAGGGAAANTAAWLAHLGHPTAYVGRVGDDLLGRAAVDELVATGVDVRAAVDPALPTGVCVVVATPDGERSMFPSAGANAGLVDGDLPLDLFVPGNHLHLSGYTLLNAGSRGAGLTALRLARGAGMTVSVDPASAGPLETVGVAEFLEWTRGADLLLANVDEARLLSGCTDLDAAGRALAGRYREVVVKVGADGARWFGPGGAHASVPAVPVAVVDTTGAGDCFAAGFLPAWTVGATPDQALGSGCRCAAEAVSRPGARPRRP